MRRLEQTKELRFRGLRSTDVDLTADNSPSLVAELFDEDSAVILGARIRPTTDPLATLRAETTMAVNIAQALRSAKRRPARCVLLSSIAVYGDSESNLDIRETTPLAPSNLYGAGKLIAEMVTSHATSHANIPLVILRPCMIYGPADQSIAYGPTRFIKSIIQNNSVDLFGDGSELREYLYSPDVAEVIQRIVMSDFTGTFNLSSGHPVTFADLARMLQRCTDSRFTVNFAPRNRAKTDQRVNGSRLRSALPDLEFTDLESGLCKTFESFQQSLGRT